MNLNIKQVLTVSIFSALGIAGISVINVYGQLPKSPTKFEADLNGRIEVQGKVIDQDGNPVLGVTAKVRKVTFVEDLNGISRESESEETIESEFRFACDWCYSLDVHFLKRGYFPVSRTWSFGREDGISAGEISIEDIAIVMEEKPVPVKVKPFGGSVALDQAGVTKVLSCGGSSNGSVAVGPQKAEISRLSRYISLRADLAADGSFRRRPVNTREGETLQRERPAGVSLVLSAPEDGLAVYSPIADSRIADLVFREMREAPETGYKNEIEFDGPSSAGGKVYFYCRIGGLYGKGFVNEPSFKNTHRRDEVETIVRIRLNPNGSRNVTTHY